MPVARAPQSVHRGIEQRGSVAASVRLVDNKQRPDVAGLRVRAGKALNASSSSETRKIASSMYQATSSSVTSAGLSSGFSAVPLRT